MKGGLQFRLFGIPVLVQPWFLLTAVFIGPHQGPLDRLVIWVVVAFAGVLLHELGHAAAFRAFGFEPRIELHAMGGLTAASGGHRMGRLRDAAISAAGPALGIAIGLVCLGLRAVLNPGPGSLAVVMEYLVWVNLGWGLLNLVPVLPLDGGQIASALAQHFFPRRGLRVARMVSLALTVLLAVWAVLMQQLWMLVLGIVLSVYNYRALQHEAGDHAYRQDFESD